MKFKYDKETEKLILTQSTRIEHHQLQLWLTRFVKGYKFSQPYKMKIWNGKESYFENGKVNLGLWKECMLACKEIDYNLFKTITLAQLRELLQKKENEFNNI